MTTQAQVVEMERALLGCTTHCSGILQVWTRCHQEQADMQAIGQQLLERSEKRHHTAVLAESRLSVQRELLLQPFIKALFSLTIESGSNT